MVGFQPLNDIKHKCKIVPTTTMSSPIETASAEYLLFFFVVSPHTPPPCKHNSPSTGTKKRWLRLGFRCSLWVYPRTPFVQLRPYFHPKTMTWDLRGRTTETDSQKNPRQLNIYIYICIYMRWPPSALNFALVPILGSMDTCHKVNAYFFFLILAVYKCLTMCPMSDVKLSL